MTENTATFQEPDWLAIAIEERDGLLDQLPRLDLVIRTLGQNCDSQVRQLRVLEQEKHSLLQSLTVLSEEFRNLQNVHGAMITDRDRSVAMLEDKVKTLAGHKRDLENQLKEAQVQLDSPNKKLPRKSSR